MFNVHKESFEWGGRTLTLETGKIARQADGAVLATYGETVVLATVVGAQHAARGRGFLPAHRELPGTLLRRRQDPGRLFQARARADRARDPDLAPDRPPHPSAVRRRLSQRDAGRGAGALPRPGERSRCRGDGRGVRRADHFRPALHGPDRRGARRLHRRRIQAQPADRRDAEFQARTRRRRHRATP